MVAMLQTLDGGGNVSYHFGSVTIDRNPHFFGPGLFIYWIQFSLNRYFPQCESHSAWYIYLFLDNQE